LILRTLIQSVNYTAEMTTTTKSGLIYSEITDGAGAEAASGMMVEVHYTGWLYIDGKRGNQFDSSVGRGPFSFNLGAGQVIKGWDEGVQGMKIGGKRELIIPPQLGYGARAIPGVIPANSTLCFEVELLAVK
jgi:FKBP-type peptidyl-prolyl cis-trans isomerase